MSLRLNSSAGVKVNILQVDELYDVKKMIYNGNVVIKKMYEKKYLPPIKGRKGGGHGLPEPCACDLLLKAAVFFFF